MDQKREVPDFLQRHSTQRPRQQFHTIRQHSLVFVQESSTMSKLFSLNGSLWKFCSGRNIPKGQARQRFFSTTKALLDETNVILHQYMRGKFAPSTSPFPMKVETYLRANKIAYQVDFTRPLGPKGKTPWITYQKQNLGDSQFIIEYLNEKFSINMNGHLNKVEKAIARSFRIMVEEHLYWTIVYSRWVLDKGQGALEISGWPNNFKGKLMVALVRKRMEKECWNQGIGRHSPEEISALAVKDVKAVSMLLGMIFPLSMEFVGQQAKDWSKPYLMGSKICEEDCSLFGFLTQLIYHPQGFEEEMEMLLEECPNLSEYCNRIRNKYWPDWNDVLRKKSSKL